MESPQTLHNGMTRFDQLRTLEVDWRTVDS